MKTWVTNNFWIKIVSLILAVITWFYVNGELSKERLATRKFYIPPATQFMPKDTFSIENNKEEDGEKNPKRTMNKGYLFKRK